MALRILALTDTIIGLEAELAEQTYRADMARLGHAAALEREVDLIAQLDALRATPTWKVGRIVAAPIRSLRWLLARRAGSGP